MKKLTAKSRARQVRAARAWRRRTTRARILARRGKICLRRERGAKRFGAFSVEAPVHLRFHGTSKTRAVFDAFVARVELGLRLGRRVRIDFSATSKLFPCGMLLLLGHLDTWLRKWPLGLECTYPSDEVVEEMLQSAGVLRRLGRSDRRVISHDEVTKWHQFEGQTVDATPLEGFMDEVRDATGVEWQTGLGCCVTEALTNVKNHAYPGMGSARWWMFATVNRSKGQIFVAMHDRGESIPGTLLAKPELVDYITARMLRRGGDCELIAAAAGGRTRTRLYYRGKGLPEMLEFTARHKSNALAIYSRRGYFTAFNGAATRVQGTLSRPVEGTLVIWTLNFEQKP